MYYRITRSAITVLILTLAVAFMSYVLFYGIISSDTKSFAFDEIKKTRFLGEWISRLSAPDMEQAIYRNILDGNNNRIAEYRFWAGLGDVETDSLTRMCRRLDSFYSYFDRIPGPSADMLLAGNDPYSFAIRLAEKDRLEAFAEKAEQLKLRLPLGGKDELFKLLTVEAPQTRLAADRIQAGQQAACRKVASAAKEQTYVDLFASRDKNFAEILKDAGFIITENDFDRLSNLAGAELELGKFSAILEKPETREAVGRLTGTTAADVNLAGLIEWAGGRSGAEKAALVINKTLPDSQQVNKDVIVALVSDYLRTATLQKIAGDEEPYRRNSLLSLPPRTMWLILVSFLVCVIGISNTMLMSVTDRFNEIATMKCLGAVDGFIMTLFVFEAMVQGVIGSIAGVLLGIVLSLGRALSGFGMFAFESAAVMDIVAAGVVSFIIGIVIAALAATWPSWAAARLAPMEAMRVE
jgi:putative ABC transport system permease protein